MLCVSVPEKRGSKAETLLEPKRDFPNQLIKKENRLLHKIQLMSKKYPVRVLNRGMTWGSCEVASSPASGGGLVNREWLDYKGRRGDCRVRVWSKTGLRVNLPFGASRFLLGGWCKVGGKGGGTGGIWMGGGKKHGREVLETVASG